MPIHPFSYEQPCFFLMTYEGKHDGKRCDIDTYYVPSDHEVVYQWGPEPGQYFKSPTHCLSDDSMVGAALKWHIRRYTLSRMDANIALQTCAEEVKQDILRKACLDLEHFETKELLKILKPNGRGLRALNLPVSARDMYILGIATLIRTITDHRINTLS